MDKKTLIEVIHRIVKAEVKKEVKKIKSQVIRELHSDMKEALTEYKTDDPVLNEVDRRRSASDFSKQSVRAGMAASKETQQISEVADKRDISSVRQRIREVQEQAQINVDHAINEGVQQDWDQPQYDPDEYEDYPEMHNPFKQLVNDQRRNSQQVPHAQQQASSFDQAQGNQNVPEHLRKIATRDYSELVNRF